MSEQINRSTTNCEHWYSRGEGPPRDTQQRAPTGHTCTSVPTFPIGNYNVPTDPGPAWMGQTILSLDGGGIRGYWSLLALQKLMYHIAKQEDEQEQAEQKRLSTQDLYSPNHPSSFDPIPYPEAAARKPRTATYRSLHPSTGLPMNVSSQRYLPVHYFDYMCGSSTGALIALMLSRFRMTVDDCMEEYKTLAGSIFGKPTRLTYRGFPVLPKSKYSSENVQRVYHMLASKREAKDREPPYRLGTEIGVTKVCVATAFEMKPTKNQSAHNIAGMLTPDWIRSYWLPSTAVNITSDRPTVKMDRDWGVVDVALAATAAPLYFDPLEMEVANGQTMILIDGGLAHYNNPTQSVYEEVQKIHGKENIGTVVSIGTSRQDAQDTRYHLGKVKKVLNTAANPEATHQTMLGKTCEDKVPYFRFNAHGTLGLPLDDWRPRKPNKKGLADGYFTIQEIEQNFTTYYSKKHNHTFFTECARLLVKRRRARSKNTDLWDRFANASYYRCDCGSVINLKTEFQAHVERSHGDWIYDSIEDLCRRHRHQWEYQEPAMQRNF